MNGKKLIVAISLIVLLLALSIQTFAAESVTAEIPFIIENIPGTAVIVALDGAPLPEQTVFEGVFEGSFEISYSAPGNYYYMIYQEPGSEDGIEYDEIVYSACVSVFQNEDGGMYCVTEVSIESSALKTDAVMFGNYVSEPSEPDDSEDSDTPQTGDNSKLPLWFALMFVSFSGIVVCLLTQKRAHER